MRYCYLFLDGVERSCHFLHDSCYLAEVSSYSSEPSDTQLSLREGEMGREYTLMVLQEVVAPTHTTFEGTSWARSHAIWLATCLYQDHVHWTMAIWLAIRLYQDHIGPWPSGWLYVCTKITLDRATNLYFCCCGNYTYCINLMTKEQ